MFEQTDRYLNWDLIKVALEPTYIMLVDSEILQSNKKPTVHSPGLSSAGFGANIVLFFILSPLERTLSLGMNRRETLGGSCTVPTGGENGDIFHRSNGYIISNQNRIIDHLPLSLALYFDSLFCLCLLLLPPSLLRYLHIFDFTKLKNTAPWKVYDLSACM